MTEAVKCVPWCTREHFNIFENILRHIYKGHYIVAKLVILERNSEFFAQQKEIGMQDLTSMRNIGKEMDKKLKSVGIDSPDRLRELGSKQVFLKLKEVYPQICLVHLYALEGAVEDLEFNSLSDGKKKELKEFSDFLKK